MPSILFVCTANICRSPMAASLFKHKLEREGVLQEWKVESAGTWAREGEAAAIRAREVISSLGLNLEEHSSKRVSQELLRSFDLILTMEKGHKEALKAEFPEFASRIYLLTEMAGYVQDIVDPIGGSRVDFEDTIREFENLIEKGFPKILHLAKKNN